MTNKSCEHGDNGKAEHEEKPSASTDIALEILGSCTCHDSYKRRNKEDPNCQWHQHSYYFIKALEQERLAWEKKVAELEKEVKGWKQNHETIVEITNLDLNKMKSKLDEAVMALERILKAKSHDEIDEIVEEALRKIKESK